MSVLVAWISLLFHPKISTWDCCSGTCCLLGPREAPHQISFVRCIKTRMIRKLQQVSGQTVGSKRSWLWQPVFRRQQASLISFSIATTSNSNVVDFFFFCSLLCYLESVQNVVLSWVCPDCCVIWSLSRLLCYRFWLQCRLYPYVEKYFHVVFNLVELVQRVNRQFDDWAVVVVWRK